MKLVCLLIFSFISTLSFAQNLKTVKGYMYQVEQNEVTSDTVLSSIKYYNEENKLMKEEKYWTTEEGLNIEKIIYTEKEDIQKQEYILNDSVYKSSEFERDEHNELKRQILLYKNNKKSLSHQNSYNKKGQLIKSVVVFENAPKEIAKEFTSYNVYKYDKEGNLTQLTQYVKQEKLQFYTYQYDKNKNLIEENSVNYRTKENFKTICLYDKDNQVIKKSVYQNEEWNYTIDTTWENKIIKEQIIYYSPFTKEEYHEVTFFEVE